MKRLRYLVTLAPFSEERSLNWIGYLNIDTFDSFFFDAKKHRKIPGLQFDACLLALNR
jgi:hypothetical protein